MPSCHDRAGHARVRRHAGVATYEPRTTQQCDAVTIVREHLPVFLEKLEARGISLPTFVRDELQAFTTCGDFEHGFLVAQCQRCGETRKVPFACKSRGICPSCMGRRMGETAALLVDHRLPAVPWRQWVLTFEGPVAVRLGYDQALLKKVCQRFSARVMQTLRRQAKREHGLRSVADLHAGVLLVVQRFRNDLGLFVHIHALVTDGCFAASNSAERGVVFHPVEKLGHEHLLRVLADLAADLRDHLDAEPPPPDEGVLACLQLGLWPQKPGLGPATSSSPAPQKPMTVGAFGMQLHAAVTVDGRDSAQLERVCRYLLRPAFAQDAVKALPDGRVRILYKQPTRNGATFSDISRDTFLARLAALVPAPGVHQVRSYGVLASRHALRGAVAPTTAREASEKQLELFTSKRELELPAVRGPLFQDQLRDPAPSRLGWAKLLARVFRIDVTVCPACQGPMRVVQAVTDPDDIAAHLHGARAPPRPSPPGQLALFGA